MAADEPLRTSSSFADITQIAANGIQGKISLLLSTQIFDTLMSAVILLNVGIMVVEADYSGQCVAQDKDPSECEQPWLFITNFVFLVVYTVESCLRLFSERCRFFKSGWNVLDSFIVVSGWADILLRFTVGNIPGPNTAILRIFRTTRLARIVRIVAVFPELEMLIKGFIGAMMSMFWGFIMILVFVIVFALLSVELLNPINVQLDHENEYCRDAFSSMWNACLFFMQTLVAGDSWGACTIPIIQSNKFSAIIFIVALVCVQLGVTNLILAVIVERANLAHEQDVHNRLKLKEKEHEHAAKKLKLLLQAIDEDSSGKISREELAQGFEDNPALRDKLLSMDIEKQDLNDFFKLLDICNTGEVDYDHLVDTLLSASMSDVRKPIMMLRLQAVGITRSVAELSEAVKQLSPDPTNSNELPSDSPNSQIFADAKSMLTSTTACTTQQKAQQSVVIASLGMQHSTVTDLTSLHQSLKSKLNELEQDVLRTIDSWATSYTKTRFPVEDDNTSVPKERVPLCRGDNNSGFIDHQPEHEFREKIQNGLATSDVSIGNLARELRDSNKRSV